MADGNGEISECVCTHCKQAFLPSKLGTLTFNAPDHLLKPGEPSEVLAGRWCSWECLSKHLVTLAFLVSEDRA